MDKPKTGTTWEGKEDPFWLEEFWNFVKEERRREKPETTLGDFRMIEDGFERWRKRKEQEKEKESRDEEWERNRLKRLAEDRQCREMEEKANAAYLQTEEGK
jgi:exonuclease III